MFCLKNGTLQITKNSQKRRRCDLRNSRTVSTQASQLPEPRTAIPPHNNIRPTNLSRRSTMASTNSQNANATSTPRLFIFDSTRLRSHLLFRYLSTNEALCPIYHPFLPAAMFGPEHLAQHLRHSKLRQKELDEDMLPLYGPDTYASCIEDFARRVAEAEKQGKLVLSNEHWFNLLHTDLVLDLMRGKITSPSDLGSNPTYIPSHLNSTLIPIIMIRHPALAVNSIYRDALRLTKQRPGDEDFELITTNRPLRLLFDFFTQRGQRPVVVDAEDILWRPTEVVAGICEAVKSSGAVLRPEQFGETWEPTSQEVVEKMNPLVFMLTRNVHESRRIERPDEKPADPDLDKTSQEWEEKYGVDVARQLRGFAEDNLPHYEYLQKFAV